MPEYSASIPVPDNVFRYMTALKRHASHVTLYGTYTSAVISAPDEYSLASQVHDIQDELKAMGVQEPVPRPVLRKDPNPIQLFAMPEGANLREQVIALNDHFHTWRGAQNSFESPLLGWEMLNDMIADLAMLAELATSELSALEASALRVSFPEAAGIDGSDEALDVEEISEDTPPEDLFSEPFRILPSPPGSECAPSTHDLNF